MEGAALGAPLPASRLRPLTSSFAACLPSLVACSSFAAMDRYSGCSSSTTGCGRAILRRAQVNAVAAPVRRVQHESDRCIYVASCRRRSGEGQFWVRRRIRTPSTQALELVHRDWCDPNATLALWTSRLPYLSGRTERRTENWKTAPFRSSAINTHFLKLIAFTGAFVSSTNSDVASNHRATSSVAVGTGGRRY